MKKTAFTLFIIGSVLAVTSCVVENTGYNPSSYTPANAYGAPLQEVYNQGYASGKRDARQGRASNSMAGATSYDYSRRIKFIEGYNNGYRNYTRPDVNPGHIQGYGPMRATVGRGQVTITQGGRVISTLRTASPNVEEHHFTSGQKQMVIKSRGNHGPANVELFDVRTGTLRDKVLAFAIRNGQPRWARGMQD